MVSLAFESPTTGAISTPKSPLKRTASNSDISDDSQSSTPAKRSKVSFDTSINKIHNLEDYNERSSALVREEVRRAVDRHRLGDHAAYDNLRELLTVDPFSEDAISSALLRKHIHAFTTLSTFLAKGCSSLVHAIIHCSWLGRDEDFINAYLRLLVSLITAQSGYTHPILSSLVQKFVTLRSAEGNLPQEARVSRVELLDRVHRTICHVLNSIPTATGILQSILIKSFPYPTDTVQIHVRYVSCLLRVTEYAPALKSEILGTVIERVVKIDAKSQVDIDELAEELDEDLLVQVGNILQQLKDNRVVNDEDSDDEDDVTDLCSIADPSARQVEVLKLDITKLDCILDLLFEYYSSMFTKETGLAQAADFEQLMNVFIKVILPMHGSRHTQFLLFHFGQLVSRFSDQFSTSMLQLASNRNQPAMIRQSAAAYLASFIARGAHVDSQTVRHVVDVLCNELNKLRRGHVPNCNGPDLAKYGTYYCIAQALFYIFCFRWRDLITNYEEFEDNALNPADLHWIPGLKEALTRNILSKLNPLKICAPAIVTQFATICHHLEFISLHLLLEQNKRVRLARPISATGLAYTGIVDRESALSIKTGESKYQLDAYFPFDPYQLPRSKRWLEGDYVEWRGIPGLDDDEDEQPVSESQHHSEAEADDEELDDATKTRDEDNST